MQVRTRLSTVSLVGNNSVFMYLSSKIGLIKFCPNIILQPPHFAQDTVASAGSSAPLLREALGSHLCRLVYIAIPGRQGLRLPYLYLEVSQYNTTASKSPPGRPQVGRVSTAASAHWARNPRSCWHRAQGV